MARPQFLRPTVPMGVVHSARLGAGNTPSDNLSDVDQGKFVVLAGESRFNLAGVGAEIDGVITSVEQGTSGGFSVGGVFRGRAGDMLDVVFDGAQADGAGVLAIGDIVVVGTPVAKGTAQPGWPRVRKATTPANVVQKWRVVSLGTAGTGAVGTDGVIERV